MPVLIDAHVHIYPMFSLGVALDHAYRNFSVAANERAGINQTDCVLVLTESSGLHVFTELQDACLSQNKVSLDSFDSNLQWNISSAGDGESLVARREEHEVLYLIQGRQSISIENLELLSIAAVCELPDKKLSLDELARQCWDAGGIPVVPWGVGKWTGDRAKRVKQYLFDSADYPKVFGDNGNRPEFWPMAPFLNDERADYFMLSGSDPLALLNQEKMIASSGSYVDKERIAADCPAQSVKSILLHSQKTVPYGPRKGMIPFFYDQLRVNIKKRIPLL